MNNEVEDLVQRLRVFSEQFVGKSRPAKQAADLLEQQSERLAKLEERLATIYSQPVELPEPALHGGITVTKQGKYKSTEDGYTADQLTKAVQEATARALEAAAKKCDARYMGDNNREDMEAKRCASAIRNLIGKLI